MSENSPSDWIVPTCRYGHGPLTSGLMPHRLWSLFPLTANGEGGVQLLALDAPYMCAVGIYLCDTCGYNETFLSRFLPDLQPDLSKCANSLNEAEEPSRPSEAHQPDGVAIRRFDLLANRMVKSFRRICGWICHE